MTLGLLWRSVRRFCTSISKFFSRCLFPCFRCREKPRRITSPIPDLLSPAIANCQGTPDLNPSVVDADKPEEAPSSNRPSVPLEREPNECSDSSKFSVSNSSDLISVSVEDLESQLPVGDEPKLSETAAVSSESSAASCISNAEKDICVNSDAEFAQQNIKKLEINNFVDLSDRPIVGAAASFWGGTENTPRWWKGNGIPNSTTKYNEDQKVNYHATPFEERLEKALSREKDGVSTRRFVSF